MGACFGATVAYEVARQLMAAGEEVAMLGLLDPTTREGDEPDEPGVALPRTVTRVAAVGDFVTRRLRLYRREMAGLTPAQRIKYLARKLRTLGGSVAKANAFKGAERELNQLEVYRANVLALDRYHRKPLVGRLRRVEIFETGPAGPDAAIDWQDYWTGEIVRHTMPGKDSGDMLSGDNAPIVAGVLAERLRQAFSAAPAPREARATISKVYS
jgi:thioesterase domain-containing protein